MIPLPPISTLFPYTTLFRSTKEQEILIAKTIGCSRFVFNRFLGQWNDRYKETGKVLTYNSCSAELRQLKKELVWLKDVDSIDLQSSLKNLADSYTRLFKEQNKSPRFKSKNKDRKNIV